jgi:hypothetical protein
MATIKLSPDEARYLLGLLKEHLEYYRLLSGNGKCTPTTRAKLTMLEALEFKLRIMSAQSGLDEERIEELAKRFVEPIETRRSNGSVML